MEPDDGVMMMAMAMMMMMMMMTMTMMMMMMRMMMMMMMMMAVLSRSHGYNKIDLTISWMHAHNLDTCTSSARMRNATQYSTPILLSRIWTYISDKTSINPSLHQYRSP